MSLWRELLCWAVAIILTGTLVIGIFKGRNDG